MYLTTSTELHELFKIPLLFYHFQEHQAKNKELTIFSFLHEHYSGEIPTDTDWQKDSKLPFKTCQNDVSCIQWIETPTMAFQPAYISLSEKSDRYVTHTPHYASAQLNAIWHPPQRHI